MNVALGICEGNGLSRGCNLKHVKVAQNVGLTDIARIWIHEIHNMHLTALRDDDTGSQHARMHANISRAGWEGNGGHGRHLLDVKDIEKGVQDVVLPLAQRKTAGDDEIVLRVHVIDQGGVSIPYLDDGKADGIQQMDRSRSRGGADISTPSHDCVLMLGW